MTILAIDPGGTTGYAYEDSEAFGAGECSPEDVWDMLNTLQPDLLIVERFDFRQGATNTDLTPVEVIGIIKQWCRFQDVDITLVWQGSSEAKHFWNNDRLKQVGRYVSGKPHARDAVRHLLYYKTFGKGKKDGQARAYLSRLRDGATEPDSTSA